MNVFFSFHSNSTTFCISESWRSVLNNFLLCKMTQIPLQKSLFLTQINNINTLEVTPYAHSIRKIFKYFSIFLLKRKKEQKSGIIHSPNHVFFNVKIRWKKVFGRMDNSRLLFFYRFFHQSTSTTCWILKFFPTLNVLTWSIISENWGDEKIFSYSNFQNPQNSWARQKNKIKHVTFRLRSSNKYWPSAGKKSENVIYLIVIQINVFRDFTATVSLQRTKTWIKNNSSKFQIVEKNINHQY